MRGLCDEVRWFVQKKCYSLALIITVVCAYGFEITHPIIGIDDTAVSYYLEDGLDVILGRWPLFLLNKVFHLAEFTPFMMEFVGVLLLMLGAVMFCVLLRRLFGDSVGIAGYTIFACVFVSNPVISEIYFYYYHDGVDLGYILIALALMLFMDGMEQDGETGKKNGKKRALCFLGSMLLTWVAVGCYESFLILYILGILVVVFLRGMTGKDVLRTSHVMKYLGLGALISSGCVLLRSLMVALVKGIFGLHELEGVLPYFSISEMLVLFRDREGLETLVMLLKRFWVVYHLNAVVYLPVTIYEAAVWIFGICSVCLAVRKKNLWYPVLFAGMCLTPALLTIVRAQLTLYRSSQYLPFYAAAGVFLGYRFLAGLKARRAGRIAGGALALCIIWNQAFAMNKTFYVDYLKYENTKDVLISAARAIEREYGSDLPVVFTGHYSTPHALLTDYYVWYGSWQYRFIASVTDLVDPYLKDKYSSPYGYSFIGEANNPFIQWAFDAFDGTNGQMIVFLQMHGHSLRTVTDSETLEKAREIGETMPSFPREGSIVNQGDYIVVHF